MKEREEIKADLDNVVGSMAKFLYDNVTSMRNGVYVCKYETEGMEPYSQVNVQDGKFEKMSVGFIAPLEDDYFSNHPLSTVEAFLNFCKYL